MRTKTETRVVPAQEIARITYEYDAPGCTYTTSVASQAEQHYGEHHAVAELSGTEERHLFRFTNEADLRAWMNASEARTPHSPHRRCVAFLLSWCGVLARCTDPADT